MTVESGAGASGEFDAKLYKMMLEFERRLDTKLSESRAQTRDDIQSALAPVRVEVSAISVRIQEITKRLDDGSRKFDEQNQRLGQASALVKAVKAEVDKTKEAVSKSQAALQLQRADGGPQTTAGWISVEKIPAILMAFSSLLATIMASVALFRSGNGGPYKPLQPPAAVQPAAGVQPPGVP